MSDLYSKWITLGTPISFGGVTKIYEHYKKRKPKREIEHILSSIPTYSKFKESKKPRFYNPVFIYHRHQQWQIDLTYIADLRQWNDDVAYLLIVIECFTRKIFVAPMTDKATLTTVTKFDDIHTLMGQSPETIYMDKGSEFNSRTFKSYCQEHNIKPIYSNSSTKAPHVERAQRTLQGIIYKYLAHTNTKRYIDRLGDMVRSFNEKTNRTIKMSPNMAYFGDHDTTILNNLEHYYKKALSKRKKHSKYKVGDKVRILYVRGGSLPRRGYKQTFSEEIFKIDKVDARLPLFRYHIKDSNNELIIGSFLQHELSLVSERPANSSETQRSKGFRSRKAKTKDNSPRIDNISQVNEGIRTRSGRIVRAARRYDDEFAVGMVTRRM